MKCTVTFRQVEPSERLRVFAEERVEKLRRWVDGTVEAQLTLSVEKHRQAAHIELVADGSVVVQATEESEDLLASIEGAVERVLRQLKRSRDKSKERRVSTAGRNALTAWPAEASLPNR